jgi:glutamate-1-semialdehyde 2,1-aminomutase
LATLKEVLREGFFERLEATTRELAAGLVAAAKASAVPFSAASAGGMFGIFFRAAAPSSFAEVMQCDRDRFNRFFHAMLERGIYLAPSAFEAGFVSAAHGRSELDATFAAARESFRLAGEA